MSRAGRDASRVLSLSGGWAILRHGAVAAPREPHGVITQDDGIWDSVIAEAGRDGGDDRARAISDLGAIMRALGLRGIRLGDGTRALGSPFGDGAWHVLQTASGDVMPANGRRDVPEWRAGKLDGDTGLGFMTAAPRRLAEAVTEMIRMPTPRAPDGHVLSRVVEDHFEAETLMAEAVEDAAPAPGM